MGEIVQPKPIIQSTVTTQLLLLVRGQSFTYRRTNSWKSGQGLNIWYLCVDLDTVLQWWNRAACLEDQAFPVRAKNCLFWKAPLSAEDDPYMGYQSSSSVGWNWESVANLIPGMLPLQPAEGCLWPKRSRRRKQLVTLLEKLVSLGAMLLSQPGDVVRDNEFINLSFKIVRLTAPKCILKKKTTNIKGFNNLSYS